MSKAVLSTLVFLFDLSALVFAWAGGFLLRFNFDVPANFAFALWWGLIVLLPVHALACRFAGLYRGIWLFAIRQPEQPQLATFSVLVHEA